MKHPVESIEIIPMTKETIFEEPYVEVPETPEQGGTTSDAELWLEIQLNMLKNQIDDQSQFGGFYRVIEMPTSRWFAMKFPNAKFMLGPVAVIDNNGTPSTLTAKSRKVEDFSEFLEYISNRHIWLYQILFQPNMPLTGSLNEKFEPELFDCPVVDTKAGYWIVRYGELTE